MQALLDNCDAVVATWSWLATHTNDVGGFPATHDVLTMSGSAVYYFNAEDRLTGHWQIVDRLGVFQQLHAMRQAQAGPPSATG